MGTTMCLVCGSTLDAPPLLCSSRCAVAAGTEIDRNVVRSRRIGRRRTGDPLRYDLARRNGQLTAALMALPQRLARQPQPEAHTASEKP